MASSALVLWQGARTYVPRAQAPVASALQRFTTRFGMGRGGTTARDAHPVAEGGTGPTLPTGARGLSVLELLPLLLAPVRRSRQGREALGSAHPSPPRVATRPV